MVCALGVLLVIYVFEIYISRNKEQRRNTIRVSYILLSCSSKPTNRDKVILFDTKKHGVLIDWLSDCQEQFMLIDRKKDMLQSLIAFDWHVGISFESTGSAVKQIKRRSSRAAATWANSSFSQVWPGCYEDRTGSNFIHG